MTTPPVQVGRRFGVPMQTLVGGRFTPGLRTYDVVLAHDPLAIVQTPIRLLASPFEPSRTALRAGLWGRRNWRPHRPPHSMLEMGVLTGVGPRETVIDLRPADTTQVVQWHNPIRFQDIRPFVAPLVYELVRTMAMRPGVGVLEKIATWLRAQALDAAGQPIAGAVFETFQDTSPVVYPLPHPQGLGDLTVAWYLIADPAAELPAFLQGVSPSTIPAGEQLPGLERRWADNRYSWGSRYTESHYAVIPQDNTVRLFVEIGGSTRWLVEAGGQIAAHSRIQGPAALRAAEIR